MAMQTHLPMLHLTNSVNPKLFSFLSRSALLLIRNLCGMNLLLVISCLYIVLLFQCIKILPDRRLNS